MKQGDIPAPTLFSIYFAVMLSYALQHCDIRLYICFRTFGKVFNLRRFNTKLKASQSLVRELLFSDEADLVAHTEEDMQLTMDIISRACFAFGLTINLKKTKVMYTPPIGQVYVEHNITVEGNSLSWKGTHSGTHSANTAFGKLEKRVWSDQTQCI